MLFGLTAGVTAGMAALAVPSPALFAGRLVATVLALAGQAPERVPQSATTLAQAVIGVVIGLLARPDTLSGLAQDWLPVLLISLAMLVVSMAAGLLLGLRRGVTPLTGMLALTAGGASGLVATSRDLGGDERLVAAVQYLRVGLVTATMPVVAALAFGANAAAARRLRPRSHRGGTGWCSHRQRPPSCALLPRWTEVPSPRSGRRTSSAIGRTT